MNSKALESFLIPKDSIANEGLFNKSLKKVSNQLPNGMGEVTALHKYIDDKKLYNKTDSETKANAQGSYVYQKLIDEKHDDPGAAMVGMKMIIHEYHSPESNYPTWIVMTLFDNKPDSFLISRIGKPDIKFKWNDVVINARKYSKASESFNSDSSITTEGLFDRFKHKSIYPTSSQSIIKDVSKEKADPRFLIGGSNKPYHGYIPYSNKSIIGNYFHYYEDINPAVNKAGQKIKTIAKSKKSLWDQTPKGIEAFLNAVFEVFSNSKEWKTICDIQNMISVIDSSIYDPNFKTLNDNLYELSDDDKIMSDTINEWKFIHKTEFLDCIIYDYDLISCSQDQFFRADDIISYLLDCAVSIFDNITANCFTDDIEVFSVVIHK